MPTRRCGAWWSCFAWLEARLTGEIRLLAVLWRPRWLYQAGYSIDHIKRHARWLTNAVRVYLWEGSGLHGMVKAMSEVKFQLHVHMVYLT